MLYPLQHRVHTAQDVPDYEILIHYSRKLIDYWYNILYTSFTLIINLPIVIV